MFKCIAGISKKTMVRHIVESLSEQAEPTTCTSLSWTKQKNMLKHLIPRNINVESLKEVRNGAGTEPTAAITNQNSEHWRINPRSHRNCEQMKQWITSQTRYNSATTIQVTLNEQLDASERNTSTPTKKHRRRHLGVATVTNLLVIGFLHAFLPTAAYKIRWIYINFGSWGMIYRIRIWYTE